MMDLDALGRRLASAKDRRSNWDTMWQDIADRVLPSMADFNVMRADGEKRTDLMYDGTAALALNKAVAAIATFFWPANQRYQKLTTTDPTLNKAHRVQVYMDALTDTLFRIRYSPRSAFEQQMQEVGMQFMGFGTGLIFVDEDIKTRALRYKSLHLAQCYLEENYGGRVDTVMRTWNWSLRQIDQRFPGKLSEDLRQKLAQRPDDRVEVCHAVMPREDVDPEKPGYMGMPWASCYWLPAHKIKLEEGGYRTWPFGVIRYMTSPGEVYGRSPTWLAMPNIRTLNAQKKSILQAAQRVVDPPLLLHEDGVLHAFSLAPGALNYGGVSSDGRQMVVPLQTNARVDIGLDMMNMERDIISGSYMLDVFRVLIENPQMTATHALELLRERANIMAPIGGRIESEGLSPITERELDLLAAAGQLPEMPPEMIEAQGEYKIEYTSPMRQSMRAGEALAISRTLEAIMPFAQANPRVLRVFDEVETARELAEINGVPAKVLRSPEQIAEMDEAEGEQDQAAALLEAAPVVSQAAANMAKVQAAGGVSAI